MPDSREPELARLVEAVRAGPKYGRIAEDFVTSLARREQAKGRNFKETVKAVRNKLHQVAGAYLAEEMRYQTWLAEIGTALQRNDPPALKAACTKAMRYHTSTRERLDILDHFYSETLSGLPPVRSVLDIACGLNPLAIAWMPLAEGVEYRAVDIYLDMMEFLGSFFALLEINGKALAADVIESPPTGRVDLAMVLKAIPCLEQADRRSGERLLSAIQADYLLISFPVHSLGGRDKGMPANYESRFLELAESQGWTSFQRFAFSSELAFLVKR